MMPIRLQRSLFRRSLRRPLRNTNVKVILPEGVPAFTVSERVQFLANKRFIPSVLLYSQYVNCNSDAIYIFLTHRWINFAEIEFFDVLPPHILQILQHPPIQKFFNSNSFEWESNCRLNAILKLAHLGVSEESIEYAIQVKRYLRRSLSLLMSSAGLLIFGYQIKEKITHKNAFEVDEVNVNYFKPTNIVIFSMLAILYVYFIFIFNNMMNTIMIRLTDYFTALDAEVNEYFMNDMHSLTPNMIGKYLIERRLLTEYFMRNHELSYQQSDILDKPFILPMLLSHQSSLKLSDCFAVFDNVSLTSNQKSVLQNPALYRTLRSTHMSKSQSLRRFIYMSQQDNAIRIARIDRAIKAVFTITLSLFIIIGSFLSAYRFLPKYRVWSLATLPVVALISPFISNGLLGIVQSVRKGLGYFSSETHIDGFKLKKESEYEPERIIRVETETSELETSNLRPLLPVSAARPSVSV